MPQPTNESAGAPAVDLHIASALRERLREGYGARDLKADLLAGLVVAMVALPLGMALAIASGVAPQHGLYTVIVAGIAVALLGGSRFQVSGPTAAFVVILAPITAKFGLAGLLTAGLMAGVILVVLGIAGMGQLIRFIPHPVTTGFTAGIALVIATIQLKDFFGLQMAGTPESYFERIEALWHARATFSPAAIAVGAFTLAIITFWPSRLNAKLPSPLVALTAAALAGLAIERWAGARIETIGTRFGGIPGSPPSFTLPWTLPGAGGGAFVLSLETIRALLPSAVAIALLGAIESLLSAVVGDAMAGTRHDPDGELIASGIGNILCPFFGGIAATGAIARTATNIRSGATSPFASMFHGGFVAVAVLFLAPVVSYLPMAALAALLLRIAYNISEVKHFAHTVRVAPRSDVVVLLTCFGLTVVFDMVVGVSVGIVLAALLFMRRMSDLVQARVLESDAALPALKEPLPPEVMVYEIAGPLFFGAAQRAVDAILTRRAPTDRLRVAIFHMANVPVMDVTGLVALETSIKSLVARRCHVVLAGVQGQPRSLIERGAHLVQEDGLVKIAESLELAIAYGRRIAEAPLTQSGRWKVPEAAAALLKHGKA